MVTAGVAVAATAAVVATPADAGPHGVLQRAPGGGGRAERGGERAQQRKRVEGALSERERQQLEHLCIARAGAGEPYSADEYISTLVRRDWERWLEQEAMLKQHTCQHCDGQLPKGCGGGHGGEAACWLTRGKRALAL